MIRLAIYFTPSPDSRLAVAGKRWIGRDLSGVTLPIGELPPEICFQRHKEITSSPFHYGFHATIKAPFRLHPDKTIEQISLRLKSFSANQNSFFLPPLELDLIQDFYCLRPTDKCSLLDKLAQNAVVVFDDFRQEPEPEELEKRRKKKLTPKQESMLMKWGYPYVMDEFRFHLTLTNRLDNLVEKKLIGCHLKKRFPYKITKAVAFDGLSLFIEINNAPMWEVQRFNFGS